MSELRASQIPETIVCRILMFEYHVLYGIYHILTTIYHILHTFCYILHTIYYILHSIPLFVVSRGRTKRKPKEQPGLGAPGGAHGEAAGAPADLGRRTPAPGHAQSFQQS